MRYKKNYDVVIIGGGFYGCVIALHAKKYFDKILLIEKEKDLLQRASFANQARIHNGYHYPRSFLTAQRSNINFPRFIKDFKKAIYKDFEKIYAVSKVGSKVNANQFIKFCREINVPLKPASEKLKKYFNQFLIESVFLAKEYVFNAEELKKLLLNKLSESGVEILLEAEVLKVSQHKSDKLILALKNGKSITSKMAFNCTYSQINTLLKNSNLPVIDLKHEITEMGLIKVPEEFQKKGITVMDGPFFSIMPFPPRKLHTISHVRFTPHLRWLDKSNYANPHRKLESLILKTKYPFMIRDASRYIPILTKCQYVESIYEVKTVLPQNEVDDGRPILFKKDYGYKNFFIVMGGKIDNIYDILEATHSEKIWG